MIDIKKLKSQENGVSTYLEAVHLAVDIDSNKISLVYAERKYLDATGERLSTSEIKPFPGTIDFAAWHESEVGQAIQAAIEQDLQDVIDGVYEPQPEE